MATGLGPIQLMILHYDISVGQVVASLSCLEL